jgi:hypothetical protein
VLGLCIRADGQMTSLATALARAVADVTRRLPEKNNERTTSARSPCAGKAARDVRLEFSARVKLRIAHPPHMSSELPPLPDAQSTPLIVQ